LKQFKLFNSDNIIKYLHCNTCQSLLHQNQTLCDKCDTGEAKSPKSTYYHVPLKRAIVDVFRDEALVSLLDYGPNLLREHAAKIENGEEVAYGDIWTGECLQEFGKKHFFDKRKVCLFVFFTNCDTQVLTL